jgi:hypothetical protein
MVAADCELPGHGYPFHARFGGGRDKDSWIDFFRTLPGMPSWIVAERQRGLTEAVADFWPGTVLFASEDRMRRALVDAAGQDGLLDGGSERGGIPVDFRKVFARLGRWQEFVEAVEELPPANSSHLRAWLDANEALVLSQFFLKKQYPNAPTEVAALEPALDDLRDKLLPHAGAMRNLWRFNLRLALMAAHWSGLDGEREYVAVLGRRFIPPVREGKAGKIARPDWASGRDFGGARSIDDFLAAAEVRRRAAAEGAAGRIELELVPNLAARNAARVAVGLTPISSGPVPPAPISKAPVPVPSSVSGGDRDLEQPVDRSWPPAESGRERVELLPRHHRLRTAGSRPPTRPHRAGAFAAQASRRGRP